MSLDSLAILEQQKTDMIELNPTSETFTIAGGPSTFIGIFDDAYDLGPKDGGHSTQRATCPAIMVATLPAGLVKGTQIDREDGIIYIWQRNATDEEGIPVILLYKDT